MRWISDKNFKTHDFLCNGREGGSIGHLVIMHLYLIILNNTDTYQANKVHQDDEQEREWGGGGCTKIENMTMQR